jgi:hypothetical protein
MIRGKMENQEMDSEDEDRAFSNCRESTASGIFLLVRAARGLQFYYFFNFLINFN